MFICFLYLIFFIFEQFFKSSKIFIESLDKQVIVTGTKKINALEAFSKFDQF